jgi:bacterioferritin-associated ferredoxin
VVSGSRDPLVCTCLTVRESEIVSAIRGGARTLAQVGERCEAGTGCHTCHPTILLLLEQEVHRALAEGRAPEPLQQLSLFEGRRPPAGPGGAARKPGEPKASEPDPAPEDQGRDQPDSAE